jgi:hypothetical protein
VEVIMRFAKLSSLLMVVLLATGCAGGWGYGPELVYAAPGVRVIADYDEPIFYADNFYWRFDGVTWYRSTYYTGGWTYAPPPSAIRQIERPRDYAHYRPSGWIARRDSNRAAPVVRERRDAPPRYEPRRVEPSRPFHEEQRRFEPNRASPPPPPPVVAPRRPPPAPEPIQVQPPRAAPRPHGPPPGQRGPHDRGQR